MKVVSQPQSSPATLPHLPSEMEAKHYYDGLPSAPVLVARTSTIPWEEHTGPEADQSFKELRPIPSNHKLREVWEGLAPKIFEVLDSMKVQWTSIDLVRIGNAEEHFARLAPVIVWIGVRPASLSGYDGLKAASKCRELLIEHDVTDVHVEIRESVVWGSHACVDNMLQSGSSS